MQSSPFVGCLISVLLTAPVVADVHVVDATGGPGSDFTSIQAAVNAAADDDVVLIRTGSYVAFTIDNVSLSVLADSGSTVSIVGGCAGQSGRFSLLQCPAERRGIRDSMRTTGEQPRTQRQSPRLPD